MKFAVPTSAQIGFKMKKYAKITAVVLAFAFVILADIAILLISGTKALYKIAYTSGYNTGAYIHGLNDKMARVSVMVSDRNWTGIASLVNTKPVTQSSPAFYHNLATIAEGMKDLKVAELRNILGSKKKYNKQQLIDMIVAVGI